METTIHFSTYNNRFSPYQQEIISSIDLKNLKKQINELTSDDVVEDGDLVFFDKSSTIPRYKFLNYCQDKKTRRVIQIDKATKIIVSPVNLLSELNSNIYGAHDYVMLPHNYFGSLQGIPAPPPIDVGRFYYININDFKNFVNKYKISSSGLTTVNIHTINTHGLNAFRLAVSVVNSKVPLVSDSTLNKQMSEGNLIVDADNYDEFFNMMRSNDKDTRSTAMELLANCNYEESIFYVSLLLNSVVAYVNEVANKTVNVRNFLEYFRDIKWNDDPMRFLKSLRQRLIKEGKLDDVKDEYIHKNAKAYIDNVIKHTGMHIEGYVTFDDNPRILTTIC